MSRKDADLVHIYLKDIGKYPLLTRDEELTYSQQLQQAIAIEQTKEKLKQELDREPTPIELSAYPD